MVIVSTNNKRVGCAILGQFSQSQSSRLILACMISYQCPHQCSSSVVCIDDQQTNMKTIEFFLLILQFSFIILEQITAQQDVCPPWFIPDNRSNTGCSCHTFFNEVICGSHSALLKLGFCMTYNYTTETAEYGPCTYITHY